MRNQAVRFFVSSPIVLAAVEWKYLQPGTSSLAGIFWRAIRGKTITPRARTYALGRLNSTTDCLTSHYLDKIMTLKSIDA